MKNKTAILTIVFILGSIAAGYVMFVAGKEVYRGKKIDQEIEKLKAEAEKIESDNSELKEKIAYLDSDQFREKIAKEKLNLRKDGEKVIEIRSASVSISEEKSEIEPIEEVKKEDLKIYQKWWRIFFDT